MTMKEARSQANNKMSTGWTLKPFVEQPAAMPLQQMKSSLKQATNQLQPRPDGLTDTSKYRKMTKSMVESNKENWDPLQQRFTNVTSTSQRLNEQQLQQSKRKHTLNSQCDWLGPMQGGPLMDITRAYNQSLNRRPTTITVQSELVHSVSSGQDNRLVGLGWSGEAFAQNAFERNQQIRAKRHYRGPSDPSKAAACDEKLEEVIVLPQVPKKAFSVVKQSTQQCKIPKPIPRSLAKLR